MKTLRPFQKSASTGGVTLRPVQSLQKVTLSERPSKLDEVASRLRDVIFPVRKHPSVLMLMAVVPSGTYYINLKSMRNDQHFQFMGETGSIVDEFGATELNVEAVFEEFQKQYDVEDEALKKIRKSALTAKIKVADRRRNDVFLGLSEICRVFSMRHYNDSLRSVATDLLVVFDSYGNLTRKPLSEKTSAIFNLVQELRDNHGEHVFALGIEEWVEGLETCNSDCKQLMQARWTEIAERNAVANVGDARTAVDAAYAALMKRILALQEIDGGEIYDNFLRRLRAVIATYNALIHRGGKKAGDENGNPTSVGSNNK